MPKPWINLAFACFVLLVASLVIDHREWPSWVELPLVALIGAGSYMLCARALMYHSARRHNPPFLRTPTHRKAPRRH